MRSRSSLIRLILASAARPSASNDAVEGLGAGAGVSLGLAFGEAFNAVAVGLAELLLAATVLLPQPGRGLGAHLRYGARVPDGKR